MPWFLPHAFTHLLSPALSSCLSSTFLFLYSRFCPNTWKQVRQTTAGQIPAGEQTPALCMATRTGLEPLLRGPQLNHSPWPLARCGAEARWEQEGSPSRPGGPPHPPTCSVTGT